jgi:Meiotically Up-regulated Gene 113 (MUG113) protein
VQEGEHGPVKIGLSNELERRLGDLQTGNPDELVLRHVVPGDRAVEAQLHARFKPARIRREWFGGEYLPLIMAFAGGLADEMLHRYDGSGRAPALSGGRVRSEREVMRIRRDIERLYLAGHSLDAIAYYTRLDRDEMDEHIVAMRRSTLYDISARSGNGLIEFARFPRKRQRRSARHRAGSGSPARRFAGSREPHPPATAPSTHHDWLGGCSSEQRRWETVSGDTSEPSQPSKTKARICGPFRSG